MGHRVSPFRAMKCEGLSFLFQSLFSKISLSVGFVVTLTLAIFAFFLIENQKEHLLYAKMKEIETLSTLINHGVITFMKEGETKDFHNFLNLVRNCRRPAGSPHPGRERNGSPFLPQNRRGNIHGLPVFQGRKSGKENSPSLSRKSRGKPFLSTIKTFQNEPTCFSCHGNQKKILGILHVSLPMEATIQSIRFNRNLLITSTAITLLLMAMAINLLLTRLVKEPTARLIETMSQVEEGNFDVKINLGTRDELGRLAKNFSFHGSEALCGAKRGRKTTPAAN